MPVTMLSWMPSAPLHVQPVWDLRWYHAGRLCWPHGKMVQSEVSGVCLLGSGSWCPYLSYEVAQLH